eukprot:10430791-Alexandrium_andersonii.AAC.1
MHTATRACPPSTVCLRHHEQTPGSVGVRPCNFGGHRGQFHRGARDFPAKLPSKNATNTPLHWATLMVYDRQ